MISYVRKVRQKWFFSEDLQRPLIADVFKGHWTNAVVTEGKRSNGKMCATLSNITFFNPSICPLTEAVSTFYVDKHSVGILYKKAHKINVDTRISIMKLLHAKWVISCHDYMKNHNGIVLTGWRKSNIEEVFNSEQDIESDPFLYKI